MKIRRIIGVALCVCVVITAFVLRWVGVELVSGPTVSSHSPLSGLHVSDVEYDLNLCVAIPLVILFVAGVLIAVLPFHRRAAI